MTMRVLVVEDAAPIRRSLVAMVKSLQANVQLLVLDAKDGKNALALMQSEPVDVVITDIQMPNMDGLELCARLRQKYPETICVILTNYQEFEYAQTALREDVFDYLLKPTSEETLEKLFQRIIAVYTAKHIQKQEVAWEEYLCDIKKQCPDTSGSDYYAGLLFAGSFPLVLEEQYSCANMFYNTYFVRTALEKFTLQKGYSVFNGIFLAERYFICKASETNSTDVIDAFRTVFEQVQRESVPATFAYVSEKVSAQELPNMLKKLRKHIYFHAEFAKSSLICVNDFNSMPILKHDFMLQQKKVQESAAKGDFDMVKQAVHALLLQCETAKMEQYALRKLLEELVVGCLNAKHHTLETLELDTLLYEVGTIMAKTCSYSTLYNEFIALLQNCMTDRAGTAVKEKMPQIVSRVERYLHENYAEQITNQVLSEEFRFVPSYISRVFCQYMKVSPKKYLLEIRIQHAKELLNSFPNMMVKEVAAKVGFSDAQYFSKVFHEKTGQWPTDYQHDVGKRSH